MSDEEIVRRIRGGDRSLFEVIMRRYNQRLYRIARAIVRDDGEAEDVVQVAYVSAFRHLGQFQERAKFSTWLTRIAVHEAIARARRSARFVSIDQPHAEEEGMRQMPAPDRTPEARAYDRELASVIERALAELPEGFRTVFVLREIEGLSTLETAECLRLNADTVKTRLHRARAWLRRDLTVKIGTAATSAYPFGAERCDRVVERVNAAIASVTPVGRIVVS